MPFPATHPSLARALADKGYAEPTPVQAAVIESDAAERDLLVSAQTGSGKTVAYGLALAPTLLGEAERFGAPAEPLALVIAPTRELALQVQRELIWLYGPAGARVTSCVGGMDVRREARALEDGCHIVVGTPGRLRDHLERGRLDISVLRAVVLDEADEMLDLGFREDLEFILDATPEERRTLLFSATLPREIAALARSYQRDALRIDTVDKSQPHGDIEYRAVRIAPNEIEHAVVNVLRFFEMRGAMVFCHTREAVRHLHASLTERGFSAVALSGELTQNERSHALQALRDGRARVCVATDVAARGIDLPDLGLVIHADLPNDKETLLHRSGRTGRAGRKGVCVLLVPFTRRRKAEALIAGARVDVEWGPPPTADEIRAGDQQRLAQELAALEEPTDEDLALARMLLAERSPEEIATALARLYRARLPAPEELVDVGEKPTRRPKEAREETGGRERRERVPGDRPEAPMVWFRMNVGRSNNADPRWLLPIICRLGHVTKREIGPIRIFDRDTKFGIVESMAPKFAAAVRRSSNDEDIRIEPASPPGENDRTGPSYRAKKPFRKGAPHGAERGSDGPGKKDRFVGKGGKPAGKKRSRPKAG
ncbi:MAG TPA: DEAD/DEAH box helicase [Microvirga sp.]|jgi:ATP-dependent RNA helicase DeaD|nr:DEAD/DEAH box helicase [Microvirga sp.]